SGTERPLTRPSQGHKRSRRRRGGPADESQPGSAVLAEFGVAVIARRAGRAASRVLDGGLFAALAQPLRKVSFDLIAVAGAGVELFEQPRGARAQAAAHLAEILLRELPHRSIELEILD